MSPEILVNYEHIDWGEGKFETDEVFWCWKCGCETPDIDDNVCAECLTTRINLTELI